jgi:hypothetical protein
MENIVYVMVNTELLAVLAIFVTGLYVGFKVREASYNLRNYVIKRKKFEEKSNL